MVSKAKKALLINTASQEYQVKTYPELYKYVGGVGIGLKLYQMYQNLDPIIFSIGPLNGFFPFAAKTSVVLSDNGVIEDLYVGGSLSTRIGFSGADSIVIFGRSKKECILDIHNTQVSFKSAETDTASLGLPGKRSVIASIQNETTRPKGQSPFFCSGKDNSHSQTKVLDLPSQNKVLLDEYFTAGENFLAEKLKEKKINGIVITGTETHTLKNPEKYNELFSSLLLKTHDMAVKPALFPSCSMCPMGCEKSKVGEIGGNVLIHSLVACEFAEKNYSDMGVVFSCLNTLGYDYTHEDIENLPRLIEKTLKELS